MIFFANKHDPINASILMLAFLLMALSIIHFFFVTYAPMPLRIGTVFLFAGLFAQALLQFDIMALGVTEPFSHQAKPLALFAAISPPIGGFMLAWIWKTDHAKNATRALGFALAATLFACAQTFLPAMTINLLAALIFAAGFFALSFAKTTSY